MEEQANVEVGGGNKEEYSKPAAKLPASKFLPTQPPPSHTAASIAASFRHFKHSGGQWQAQGQLQGILQQSNDAPSTHLSHQLLPVNEDTTDEDMDVIKISRLLDRAPGHAWYFTLSIQVDDLLTDREVLLGSLAGGG